MGGMKPSDICELTGVADPRLSPDGTTVAYVVAAVDAGENRYTSRIWLAAVDGSSPPRPFTTGKKSDAAPRWSPDGTRLAFVSDRDDDGPQLYVIPASGGEAVRLTDFGKEGVSGPAWSPDGSTIAFTVRVRDEAYEEDDERKRRPRRFTTLAYKLDNEGWLGDRRRHVFTVAAEGSGEPVQLTDGDYDDAAPSWSPDAARIAFSSSRHPDWDTDLATDIYVVDATGGTPEKLTSTDGSSSSPSWSPDGSAIAYHYNPDIFDSPRHTRIAVIDVASRKRTVLTEDLDRNCLPFPALREPIWAGDRVLFAVEDAGNTHLAMAPADASGGLMGVVGGADIRVTGYDFAAGNGVHAASTHTTMSELFFGDRQLTNVGEAFASGRSLVEPERFTAASADGSEVGAWIMRPVGFEQGKRYPMLLNVHGGPFAQYGTSFFDEFQVYAAAGYAVVFSNPRGSSGYSEDWARAIRGTTNGGPGWGTRDYEDVMGVVDTALERFDFLDPERLGVIGGSYGGWMTSWIVGHSDRFAAACSERAVNYWPSMYGSSDFGWPFKGYIGSFLFEDPEAWIRMSPAVYAKDISTPLLILHSENDLRCPIEQAEHLFTTLRLLKREVEFVRFPAESHELSRSGSPAHRVQRFETILDFFGRYLKP